jgi:hypothetical protein
VKAIIDRVKDQCNLIWLENLNLRGTFKPVITEYIRTRRPGLVELYTEIYTKGNRMYWESLNLELMAYAESLGLPYVRDDDTMQRPFDTPPVVVNYFYHELVKKSAKEG